MDSEGDEMESDWPDVEKNTEEDKTHPLGIPSTRKNITSARWGVFPVEKSRGRLSGLKGLNYCYSYMRIGYPMGQWEPQWCQPTDKKMFRGQVKGKNQTQTMNMFTQQHTQDTLLKCLPQRDTGNNNFKIKAKLTMNRDSTSNRGGGRGLLSIWAPTRDETRSICDLLKGDSQAKEDNNENKLRRTKPVQRISS